MAVYRFKVIFEDHEDVLREIEVTGKQNYEDLHRAIQEAIGFDGTKDASFFISDDYWRKGLEVALNPRNDDEDDDDLPPSKRKKVKKMSQSKIAEFIDDPHQRFVYVSDPEVKWTLLIELSKIDKDDPKIVYPKCMKSVGEAPKQYKQKIAPPVVEDEDDEDDGKPQVEKVFMAEEEFDHSEHDGATESGEEGETAELSEEGESSGGEEESSEEESGEDFDPGAFGGEGEDF